jgi:hypothetical protein
MQESRSRAVLWIVALVIGALLALPFVLSHHRHHYTVGARVTALVIFFVAFTALARLAISVVAWLMSRNAETRATSP